MANKTATIFCRIEEDLKEQLMQYLQSQDKTLAKWLRRKIEEELASHEK
tara:strand:- start:971 stop:1117 length:147 start_codon:yes stop_codon:yes gene_type:complete